MWYYLMFEIPHATNFHRISTFQWWRLIFSRDHSVSILVLWWLYIVWWVMLILNHPLFKKFLGIGRFRVIYIQCLLNICSMLLVDIYWRSHDKQLFIQLVVHIVYPTWCFKDWLTNNRVTEIGQQLWKVGAIWRRWALIKK